MINDMHPEEIVGEYKEVTLNLYNSIARKIYIQKSKHRTLMANSLFLQQRLKELLLM